MESSRMKIAVLKMIIMVVLLVATFIDMAEAGVPSCCRYDLDCCQAVKANSNANVSVILPTNIDVTPH